MRIFNKLLLSTVIGLTFTSVGSAASESLFDTAVNPSDYMMKVSDGIEQQLQGSWIATDGNKSVGIIFMNNMMGLNYNGAAVYGTFKVDGNKLTMNCQNGSVQTWQFTLQGNQLNLDGMILTRINLTNGNGNNGGWGTNNGGGNNGGWGTNNGGGNNGGWGTNNGGGNNGGWGTNNGGGNNGGWGTNNGGGNNGGWGTNNGGGNNGGWGTNNGGGNNGDGNNGGWGTNNGGGNNGGWGTNNGGAPNGGTWDGGPWGPSDPGNTDNGGVGASVLNGRWSTQTPQGTLSFVFQNNSYIAFMNNMQIETGKYNYNQQTADFQYQVLTGQSQGVSGAHKVYIQGNLMLIVANNGNRMIFNKVN